jgi:hypothetical protein
MSAVGEAFKKAFGKPDPATPHGIRFRNAGFQGSWESLHQEIGAGWFRDGFLYLFGEGLDSLTPCLDAWSFLVPPCDDRMIIGRNAYGALLVLDNGHSPYEERVYLLDPFTVTYATAPNIQFTNLIGRALPRRELPTFLDDSAYQQWREENNAGRLDLDDVLGIKVPRALGGQLTADNVQLDGIVDYYQSTAPIYADAFAKARK